MGEEDSQGSPVGMMPGLRQPGTHARMPRAPSSRGQGDPPWSLEREHISGPPDGGLLAPELGRLIPSAHVKPLPSCRGALGRPRLSHL